METANDAVITRTSACNTSVTCAGNLQSVPSRTMASIHDLPVECLIKILSLIHRPSSIEYSVVPRYQDEAHYWYHYKSLGHLERASRVSNLWLTIAQPMLWRHINIWGEDCLGSKFKDRLELLICSSALGRFRTEELDVFVVEDRAWDESWPNEYRCLLKGLQGLSKLVMIGNQSMNAEWVELESLKDLKILHAHNIVYYETPPANFQLSTLEIEAREGDDGSFINSIFTSSSHTLTSLKLTPETSDDQSLLEALQLVQRSLQTLEIVGELWGLDEVLPNFESLINVRFTFGYYDEVPCFDYLSAALGVLPSRATSVTLSLRSQRCDMETIVEYVIDYLKSAEKGWDRLSAVEFGLCADDGGTTEELVEDVKGWAEVVHLCGERDVKITKIV
ncbi:hypothetical protein P7C70_g6098, partial [Phenoliferia sp. Uapishka_3]